MVSTYKPSYSGVGEMLRSGFLQAEMRARAERVAAVAEATAPFDVKDRDGSHYRDAFEVESGVRHAKTTRAYGRVRNTNEAAVAVEFGNKNTPEHATLRKALNAAGD